MRNETTGIVVIITTLTLIGILMVYSASAVGGDPVGKLHRELRFVALGVVLMFLASRFDYHYLADPPIYRLIVVVSALLLVLVLVPGIGTRVHGAQRWLFGFQPSEFAKFALIVLLAVKLTENQENVKSLGRGFFPAVLIGLSFSVMVLLERDLGVPVVMMGITLTLLWISGTRVSYLVASVVPLAVAVAMLIVVAPHRIRRVMVIFDPWADREGAGYHLIQSFAAFAQGAVWGRGAGASEQKLGYLPAASTDFIFAVIGEEFGLAGTTTVVVLFIALILLSLRIAANAPDLFGALLASGITALLGLQAAFIMMVTVGLLPTKGLPLPFISYGGTALMMTLGLSGILVNVGVQARLPAERRLRITGA